MSETFGLLDTQDNVWMGDTEGPNLYADEQLARLAAEVLTVKLDWPLGRIRHQPFTGATKMHDTWEAKFTTESALDYLESPTMSRRRLRRIP